MEIYTIENSETNRIPGSICIELFPERMRKAYRYRRDEDRLMCIGAGLLISCIAGIAEGNIRISAKGKPYDEKGRFFSVSHSDGCAAVAFRDCETGIDIERIAPDNLKLAPFVFTKNELSWIECDPLLRFHLLWSVKESIMKATGLGMELEPASFEVSPETGRFLYGGRVCSFSYALYKNRSAAAASFGETGELHIRNVTSEEILAICSALL